MPACLSGVSARPCSHTLTHIAHLSMHACGRPLDLPFVVPKLLQWSACFSGWWSAMWGCLGFLFVTWLAFLRSGPEPCQGSGIRMANHKSSGHTAAEKCKGLHAGSVCTKDLCMWHKLFITLCRVVFVYMTVCLCTVPACMSSMNVFKPWHTFQVYKHPRYQEVNTSHAEMLPPEMLKDVGAGSACGVTLPHRKAM